MEGDSSFIQQRLARETYFAIQFCHHFTTLSDVASEFGAGGTTKTKSGPIKASGILGYMAGGAAGYALGILAPPLASSLVKGGSLAVKSAVSSFASYHEMSSTREENKKIFAVFGDWNESKKSEHLKALIEAAVKIFRIFECQFSNVETLNDSSWKRAMAKLAEDAAERTVSYVIALDKLQLEEFSQSLLKSPSDGASAIFNAILMRCSSEKGHTVLYRYGENSQIMKTTKIFECSGYIVFNGRNTTVLEKLKEGKSWKYGYRQLLPCDNVYSPDKFLPKELTGKVAGLQKSFLEFNYKLPLDRQSIETRVHEIASDEAFKSTLGKIKSTLSDFQNNFKEFIDEFRKCTLACNEDNGSPSSNKAKSYRKVVQDIKGGVRHDNCRSFKEEMFEAVEAIPDTNLCTGIFYKMGIKTCHGAFLCVSEYRNVNEASYVYLECSSEDNVYEYQWMFCKTESPGWYTLLNRHLLEGITTWSFESLGNGNHIIVSNKLEDVQMLKEGKWRNDALWKPVKCSDNFYKLKLKSYYDNGILTWSEKQIPMTDWKIKFIQVFTALNELRQFSPGCEWHDDSLFSLAPEKQDFEAHISRFSLLAPKETFKQHKKTSKKNIGLFRNESSSMPFSRTLQELVTWKNEFSLQFNPCLKIFSKVKIDVSLSLFDEEHNIEHSIDSLNATQWTHSEKRNLETLIEIPPLHSVQVLLSVDSVDNLEIPFEAQMVVQGYTNRLVKDGPVERFSIPQDAFQEKLQANGFSLKEKVENIYNVSGTLKMTFSAQPQFFTERTLLTRVQ